MLGMTEGEECTKMFNLNPKPSKPRKVIYVIFSPYYPKGELVEEGEE